jgi:hypothetical protein
MAGRKDKNTVDYFPHYVNHGKTLFILENKFKSDGYMVWFKLLEILGKSDNHFIDCRNITDMEYLRAKMPLIQSELENILNLLAELDAIHHELWENRIIWSGNFVKQIEDVYKRRNNKCFHFYDLCSHLSIKCKHKYNDYGIYDNEKEQSKVKESKVNEYIYNKFYDLQIKDCKNEKYIQFVKYLFGDNMLKTPLIGVLSIKKQLTSSEFDIILSKCVANKKKLGDILTKIENDKKYYKGKTNLYRTLLNWAEDKFIK